MSEFMKESYDSADAVIAALKEVGYDYSAAREEIARTFDEDLFNGNWDSSTAFWDTDLALEDIRFIQEDEFDQHWTDEMPPHEDHIVFVAGHYIFI